MELWEIIMSVVIIAVGVGVIAYILLRTPKNLATVGEEGSIELGEMPEAEETAETDGKAESEESVNE